MQDIDDIIKNKKLLLPILEEIQKEYGYLPEGKLKELSTKLDIPLSRIFGTATFYFMFSVKEQGRNIIQVCNSPTCHIKGSLNLLEVLEKELGLKPGETSEDKKYTLNFSSCLGCCDKSPAVLINGKVYENMTKEKLISLIKRLK